MRDAARRMLLTTWIALSFGASNWAEQPTSTSVPDPASVPSEDGQPRQIEQGEQRREADNGFGPRGGFGKGGDGPFSITGNWVTSESVASRPHSIGYSSVKVRGGIPLWMPGGPILTANVQQTWFDVQGETAGAPLRLPRTGTIFPDSVTNVTFGLLFREKFDNGWSGTLGVNFGSASDKPFHSVRELTAGINGSLTVPLERDAWVFSIFYSPTSQLWFPIPGVAYQWRPSEELVVNVGIPFSLRYRPDDVWTFDLSYLPVTNVTAKLAARVGEFGSIYLGYFIRNETYFLADRVEYRDRFMIFDQRIAIGANVPLWRKWSADLSTGYAFDRYFYEGPRSIGSSEDRLRIDSGLFATAQVGVKF